MKIANLIIGLLIVLLIVLGLFIWRKHHLDMPQQPPPSPATTKQEPIVKPIVHYPVPESEDSSITQPPSVQAEKPTPPFAIPEGEEGNHQLLKLIVTDAKLQALVIPEHFIQRLVACVDSLPGAKLYSAQLPVKRPAGRFIVSGTPGAPQTSKRNQQRYQRYVKLLEAIDPELVVEIYIQLYPRFQQAYEQLGYKNAYFNDRLIFTLDHLLESPEPLEPIQLSQPMVNYVYADPLLENRSAGQKLMIRIGPQHRTQVKKYLRELRNRLSALKP
jgi:hypothetical protein